MNLGEASIVLRYRTPLEVIDLALRFVRTLAPKSFFLLFLLLLLPAWAICLLAQSFGLSWSWVWLLAIVLSRVLELPFTILSGKLLFDTEASLKSVLRDSLGVMTSYLGGLFLYGLLMVVSLIVVVGPLFVGASYVFLPEVILLERTASKKALKRSRNFLREKSGAGSEVFVFRIVLLVCFVVLTEVLGQALLEYVLLIFGDYNSLYKDGGSIFALLGLFAFVPYGASYRYLSYINERTRQDGWDIQVAFLKIASRHIISSDSENRGDQDVA